MLQFLLWSKLTNKFYFIKNIFWACQGKCYQLQNTETGQNWTITFSCHSHNATLFCLQFQRYLFFIFTFLLTFYMKTWSLLSFLQTIEAVGWPAQEINRSLFWQCKFYCWRCAKFALLHFRVRRLSVCSCEILSCISNRYTVWKESGFCAESQPLRLKLLLVCVFKNKCAYHIKNSEQSVTISSAATTVTYYRYFTQEDMLLICANFWLQWIQWIPCLLFWSTRAFFCDTVAVSVFIWDGD